MSMHDEVDLVEFLRARLDEDEATALDVGAEAWSLHDGWILGDASANVIVWTDDEVERGRHIARWDPARVLAEIDAKRRIIGEHEHEKADHPGKYSFGCSTCHINLAEDFRVFGDGWCSTLRLLALPYADHPDYQEGWEP